MGKQGQHSNFKNQNRELKTGRILFFLVLNFLLLAFFCSPSLAAEKTIGVIMTGDIQYYKDMHDSFMSKLRRENYADKVEIIMQRPYPDPISLSNAARKLIANEVDVIVAYGAPAALAAFREKSQIPVVYSSVYEPLTSRIKAKNITGISSKASVSSLLRYLRGITSISSLGVIYSTNEEDSIHQMKELFRLSEQYGFKVEGLNLKRHNDAKNLFSGTKVDAIFITCSSIANMASSSIFDFSRDRRIPTVAMLPDRTSHAIVTLYASPREQGEKAADKAIRIINGVHPEGIKTDSSNEIELVFNLEELIGMGFKIPMDLVTEATKLIQ